MGLSADGKLIFTVQNVYIRVVHPRLNAAAPAAISYERGSPPAGGFPSLGGETFPGRKNAADSCSRSTNLRHLLFLFSQNLSAFLPVLLRLLDPGEYHIVAVVSIV